MPITALAIGAGAGLLKSELIDKPKEERQRRLAAATQRYSPWTGLQANPVQEADPFGSMLQYGATGASMGAGIQSAQSQADLNKALSARLNTGGSLEYGGSNLAARGNTMSSPWSLSGYDYNQSPTNFWNRPNPYGG